MATEKHQKIHFSVEAADQQRARENEGREPFRADVNGRTITFNDPKDLDWKTILEIDHPIMFLRHCVNDEDREWLRDQKIKAAVFNEMIAAFQRHYGLADKGNGIDARF